MPPFCGLPAPCRTAAPAWGPPSVSAAAAAADGGLVACSLSAALQTAPLMVHALSTGRLILYRLAWRPCPTPTTHPPLSSCRCHVHLRHQGRPRCAPLPAPVRKEETRLPEHCCVLLGGWASLLPLLPAWGWAHRMLRCGKRSSPLPSCRFSPCAGRRRRLLPLPRRASRATRRRARRLPWPSEHHPSLMQPYPYCEPRWLTPPLSDSFQQQGSPKWLELAPNA